MMRTFFCLPDQVTEEILGVLNPDRTDPVGLWLYRL